MDEFESIGILIFVFIIMVFAIISTVILIDIKDILNTSNGCISYNGEKYCKEVK